MYVQYRPRHSLPLALVFANFGLVDDLLPLNKNKTQFEAQKEGKQNKALLHREALRCTQIHTDNKNQKQWQIRFLLRQTHKSTVIYT